MSHFVMLSNSALTHIVHYYCYVPSFCAITTWKSCRHVLGNAPRAAHLRVVRTPAGLPYVTVASCIFLPIYATQSSLVVLSLSISFVIAPILAISHRAPQDGSKKVPLHGHYCVLDSLISFEP